MHAERNAVLPISVYEHRTDEATQKLSVIPLDELAELIRVVDPSMAIVDPSGLDPTLRERADEANDFAPEKMFREYIPTLNPGIDPDVRICRHCMVCHFFPPSYSICDKG